MSGLSVLGRRTYCLPLLSQCVRESTSSTNRTKQINTTNQITKYHQYTSVDVSYSASEPIYHMHIMPYATLSPMSLYKSNLFPSSLKINHRALLYSFHVSFSPCYLVDWIHFCVACMACCYSPSLSTICCSIAVAFLFRLLILHLSFVRSLLTQTSPLYSSTTAAAVEAETADAEAQRSGSYGSLGESPSVLAHSTIVQLVQRPSERK